MPCWVHTPAVPLLKRMDLKDVIFVIPKEHLKTNTGYQAAVTLKLNGVEAPLIFLWEFKTGTQKNGLKFTGK